jgi:hypothetical protein
MKLFLPLMLRLYFPLRSNRLALKSKLRPTLELESGSNDPMAYVLTIAFLGLGSKSGKEFAFGCTVISPANDHWCTGRISLWEGQHLYNQ